jgi:hypothetical protein
VGGQKSNLVYFLLALRLEKKKKGRLSLRASPLEESLAGKQMPPKSQFGVLPYRGQDKTYFSIRGSKER